MDRTGIVIVSLTAAVAFALTATLYPLGSGRGAGLASERPADRWAALSEEQRARYTEEYLAIMDRPDASQVFRRARRFAALPMQERARLRELQQLMEGALAGLPAAQRMALLSLSEHARGEAVYHLLMANAPEAVRAWQEQNSAGP